MEKKKVVKLSIYASIGVIIIIAFIVINKKIDEKRIDNFYVVPNDGRYNIGMDLFENTDGKISIKGWFIDNYINPGDFSSNTTIVMLLKNENDERDIFELSTGRFMRRDLNEKFQSTTDYSKAGIEAEVKSSKIENGSYEVLFFYDPWGSETGYFGIQSGYRIVNGELITPQSIQ